MNTTDKLNVDILANAVSQALEMMAFMVTLPMEDELPIPQESIMVHMDFTGPLSGRAELLAGRDLVRQLAANVMGIDPDDPLADEKSIDAFKEMLNTTLGVMLPLITRDPSDIFDVSLPQANLYQSPAEWQYFVNQAGVMVVDIESHPLAIHLVQAI